MMNFKRKTAIRCGLLVMLLIIGYQPARAALSGNYTINPSQAASSTNYQNFASVVSDLISGTRSDGGTANGAGVSSAVTISVADGTYYETVILGQVTGTTSTNTITFTSQSKDPKKVVLIDTVATSSDATLYLDDADYITVSYLTISKGRNVGSGCAVAVENGAHFNNFIGNILIGPKPGSSFIGVPSALRSGTAGNYTADSYNVFKDNIMRNGYYTVYWIGDQGTSSETGTVFENNLIDSGTYVGAFLYWQTACVFNGNRIKDLSTNFNYSFYLYNSTGACQVIGNNITEELGGIGMYFGFVTARGNDTAIVANNMVSMGGNSTAAFYSFSIDQFGIYHNSFNLRGTNSYSYTIFMAGQNGLTVNNKLINNIIVNTQSTQNAFCVYTYYDALTSSNYNSFYNTSSNAFFYYNFNNYTTLPNHVAGTGFDNRSIFADPKFNSKTDLHIRNVALNNIGTPIAKVRKDFDGENRLFSTPDIGADEIFPRYNDAGVASIDSPVVICSGSQDVYVKLYNFGLRALTTATVHWSLNGTTQSSTYVLSSSLPVGSEMLVKVGSFTPSAISQYTIKSWTTRPNGVTDSATYNDTSTVILTKGLSGTYTIGGVSPDYANLTAAVAELNANGVCGPVIFNIRDGVYNDKVEFRNIKNTSAINTVTIRSQSGDSSKVVFDVPSSTNFAQPDYIFYFNGSKYVSIEKVTATRANGTGFYGHVVRLNGGASYNQVKNSVLQTSVLTPTTTYFKTLVYSERDFDNNNRFENNHMIGGYYSVYMYTGTFSLQVGEEGNTFINNTIDSAYQYGMLLYNQKQINVIGNTIRNFVGSANTYGVYTYYSNGPHRILSNKVDMNNGGVGLYLGFYTKGSSGNPMLVANNFVSVQGGGSGQTAGIYAQYADTARYYHNNVSITNSNSGAYAFYLSGQGENDLRNNNFANYTGGYAIYVAGTNNLVNSNFNNLYKSASSPYLGYYAGNNAIALTNWVSITGRDNNSLSVDPLYKSSSDLHISNALLDGGGQYVTAVPTDIDGEIRSLKPDIGADEIKLKLIDAGIASIDSPAIGFCAATRNVYAKLRNSGATALTSATISWTVDGTARTNVIYSGSLAKGAETMVLLGSLNVTANTNFVVKSWTSNPNGVVDSNASNDTSTRIIRAGLNGTYTIGGTTPDFANFVSAVTALNMGGVCGPVTFNVRNGMYNEQISIGKIGGSSATNTVTFQSQGNDSSLVTLDNPSSTNMRNNYTIKLTGTTYITFRKMKIARTGFDVAGMVIDYGGGCRYVKFENNIIEGPSFGLNTSYQFSQSAHLVYSAGGIDNFVTFNNNHMYYGYYAFYCLGNGANSREYNLTITNNIVESPYSGAYLWYQNILNFSKNKLIDVYGYNYGIYMYYCYEGPQVVGNQIDMSNVQQGIPVYAFYFRGSPIRNALMANNMLSTQGQYSYGMFMYYADSANIMYNSILNNSGQQNYFTGYIYGNNPRSVRHFNNIYLANGGSSILYYYNAFTQSNYNLYHNFGGAFGYYNGVQIADLPDWILASGFDNRSIDVDPEFVSLNDLHVSNTSPVNARGISNPLVTTDFDGDLRNATTPDIGADEFTPLNDDVAMKTLVTPTDGVCGDSNMAILVRISNKGMRKQIAVPVGMAYTVNGVTSFVNGIAYPNDSIASGKDTSFVLTRLNTYFGGVYRFKIYTGLTNDGNRNNDTMIFTINIAPHANTPTVSVANGCGSGSTTTLISRPQNGENTYWYNSNGTLAYVGDTFNTNLTGNTTFRVVQDAKRYIGGLNSYNNGGAYGGNNNYLNGLYFNAIEDFYLDSIKIYPEYTGDFVLNIYNSSGTPIISKKIYVYQGGNAYDSVMVPIKVFVPRGYGYIMDADGSDCGELYRNGGGAGTGTASYPYAIGNLAEITGNTAGTTGAYYFFYDWRISNKMMCPSQAITVNAGVGSGNKPVADFGIDAACAGGATKFNGKSTGTFGNFQYYFGDNSQTKTFAKDSTQYVYAKSGTYKVFLVATSAQGCSDTASGFVTIKDGAVAKFSFNTVCEGSTTIYVDSSTSNSGTLTYKWYFGDGDSAQTQNPTHAFAQGGTYKTTLMVNSSGGCTTSITKDVDVWRKPTVKFGPFNICDVTRNITFIDSSLAGTGKITNYTWGFGDGSPADTAKNPTHKYNNLGKYLVSLSVSNEKGCTGNLSKQIELLPAPNPKFTPFAVGGSRYNFNAIDTTLSKYTWNYGETATDVVAGAKTTYAYTKTGSFKVTLISENKNGCRELYDTTVSVFTLTEDAPIALTNGLTWRAYPSPFTDVLNISYDLPISSMVEICVIDVQGRQVAVLENGMKSVGTHQTAFKKPSISGTEASQIYFIQLKVNETVLLKQVVGINR